MSTQNKERHAAYMRHYYQSNDRPYLKAKLYHVIRRCTDESFKDFRNYGGRGISVCREWIDDPEKFIEWALSAGWKRGLQIDRINNDGNYCPENCRWSTSRNNNRNRRNNKLDVEKVASIRKRFGEGASDRVIAGEFSVHRSLIYRIRKNQQWV